VELLGPPTPGWLVHSHTMEREGTMLRQYTYVTALGWNVDRIVIGLGCGHVHYTQPGEDILCQVGQHTTRRMASYILRAMRDQARRHDGRVVRS
jgi:hypothetical protein